MATLALLITGWCGAQSNVYSLAVRAGGTSYADLCSFEFPFAPHTLRLTLQSWLEDGSGLGIMDPLHKRTATDVFRRKLQVQYGSNSVTFSLVSIPPKLAKRDAGLAAQKGSSDLARTIVEYATSRGGTAVTNPIPLMQAGWLQKSQDKLDVIAVDGDHFAEMENILRQAYGPPDATLHSSAPIGNGRSLCYSPHQIGVLLNLSADLQETVVTLIAGRK